MSFDAAKWNRFQTEIDSLEKANQKDHSDYFVAIQAKGPAGELLEIKCLSSNIFIRGFQRLAIWFKAPKGTELVYARARSDSAANLLILSKLSEQIRTELRFCTLDDPHLLERMRERHITTLSSLIGPEIDQEESLPPLPFIENRASSPLSSPRSQVSGSRILEAIEGADKLDTPTSPVSERSTAPDSPRFELLEGAARLIVPGREEVLKVQELVQKAQKEEKAAQVDLKKAKEALEHARKANQSEKNRAGKLEEAKRDVQAAEERLSLANLFLEESTHTYSGLQLFFHAGEEAEKARMDENRILSQLIPLRQKGEKAIEEEKVAEKKMMSAQGKPGFFEYQQAYEEACLKRKTIEKKNNPLKFKLELDLNRLTYEREQKEKQHFFSQRAFEYTLDAAQKLEELLGLSAEDALYFEKEGLAQQAMNQSEMARSSCQRHREDMRLYQRVRSSTEEVASLMKSVCTRVNRILVDTQRPKDHSDKGESLSQLLLPLVDFRSALSPSHAPIQREKNLLWKASFEMQRLDMELGVIDTMPVGMPKAKAMLKLLERWIQDSVLLEILDTTEFHAFQRRLESSNFFNQLSTILEMEAASTQIDPQTIATFLEIQEEFNKLIERQKHLEDLPIEEAKTISHIAHELEHQCLNALKRAKDKHMVQAEHRIALAIEAKKHAQRQVRQKEEASQQETIKAFEAFKIERARLGEELKALEPLLHECQQSPYMQADSRIKRHLEALAKTLSTYQAKMAQLPLEDHEHFYNFFEDAKWLRHLRLSVAEHVHAISEAPITEQEMALMQKRSQYAQALDQLDVAKRDKSRQLAQIKQKMQQLMPRIMNPQRSLVWVVEVKKFLKTCGERLHASVLSSKAQAMMKELLVAAEGPGENARVIFLIRELVALTGSENLGLKDRIVIFSALHDLAKSLHLLNDDELSKIAQAVMALQANQTSLLRYMVLSAVEAMLQPLEDAIGHQDQEGARTICANLASYLATSNWPPVDTVVRLLDCRDFSSELAREKALACLAQVREDWHRIDDERHELAIQAQETLIIAQGMIEKSQIGKRLSDSFEDRVKAANYAKICNKIEELLPQEKWSDRNYALWSEEKWSQIISEMDQETTMPHKEGPSVIDQLLPLIDLLLNNQKVSKVYRELYEKIESLLPEARRGDRNYAQWSRNQWIEAIKGVDEPARKELIVHIARMFEEKSKQMPYRRLVCEIEAVLPPDYWADRRYETWDRAMWDRIYALMEAKTASGILDKISDWMGMSQVSTTLQLKRLVAGLGAERTRQDPYHQFCLEIEQLLPCERWGDRNYLTWTTRKWELALQGLEERERSALMPMIEKLKAQTFRSLPRDYAQDVTSLVEVKHLKEQADHVAQELLKLEGRRQRIEELHQASNRESDARVQKQDQHVKALESLMHRLDLAATSSLEVVSVFRSARRKEEELTSVSAQNKILKEQIQGYHEKFIQAKRTQSLMAMSDLISES